MPEQDLSTLRDTALEAFKLRNEDQTRSALSAFLEAANSKVNKGASEFLHSLFQFEDDETFAQVLNGLITERGNTDPNTVLEFNMADPG